MAHKQRVRVRPGKLELCPRCRKSLLSRYNLEPLCGACTRDAQTAPPPEFGAPVWSWDSLPWREALARLDLPLALAVFRAASGQTQRQLAQMLAWSQTTISLFERGKRGTLFDIRAWLHVTDAVDIPRVALLPMLLGRADAALPEEWLAEVMLPDVALSGMLEETGLDVDRRAFGGVVAGTAAWAMLPEIVVPERVTAAHVAYLRACVDSLNNRDQQVGGVALLGQALRSWRRARRMLDESDYSEVVGRDLLRVTGNMAVCAGWLAFDAGKVPMARHLYADALLLAGSASDPLLSVHVLEKSAMLASYVARTDGSKGFARESLRLANQAADAADHEPMPRLHALIALRRANALSALGDRSAFRSAITKARRELDRGVSADDPQWIQFVDESEIQGQEAIGHMNLGVPEASAAVHRQRLERPEPPRNHVCAQALLAAALAASGDVHGAVSEGLAVLPTLECGVASVRTLNELRPVRTAVAMSGPADFCARFDAVEQVLRGMWRGTEGADNA